MRAIHYAFLSAIFPLACNSNHTEPSMIATTATVVPSSAHAPSAAPESGSTREPRTLRNVARVPDKVTFRFAPPPGTRFSITTARTKTTTNTAGVTVSKGTIRTVERVTVDASSEGYQWRTAPIEPSRDPRDGQPSKIDQLVATFSLNLSIDRMGKILTIEGYDDVQAKAKAILSPAEFVAAGPSLTPEALRQARIAEWNGRIGDLAGQTIMLNDPMAGQSDVVASSINLRIYSVFVAGPWAPCIFGSCIEVTQTYDSDLQALADKAGFSKNNWQEAPGREKAPHAGAERMHGISRRTLDPATMLPVAETTMRTIVFDTASRAEEVVYQYSYESASGR